LVAALIMAKHREAEEHCSEDLGNLRLQTIPPPSTAVNGTSGGVLRASASAASPSASSSASAPAAPAGAHASWGGSLVVVAPAPATTAHMLQAWAPIAADWARDRPSLLTEIVERPESNCDGLLYAHIAVAKEMRACAAATAAAATAAAAGAAGSAGSAATSTPHGHTSLAAAHSAARLAA
jgi:hypothetical protein